MTLSYTHLPQTYLPFFEKRKNQDTHSILVILFIPRSSLMSQMFDLI